MRFHRLLTDRQLLRNLLVGAASRQLAEHLDFAPRKWVHPSRPPACRISSSTFAATLGSSRLSPLAAARTDSTTTSTPAVLSTYERAPALMASNSSSSPWCDVRMITWVDGLISLIARSAVSPSIFGI